MLESIIKFLTTLIKQFRQEQPKPIPVYIPVEKNARRTNRRRRSY